MKQKLLHEYLRHPLVPGDVGIEIEVEGNRLPDAGTPYWAAKPDGSLRNGMEYVINGAIMINDVPEALQELQKLFDKCKSKLDFSFRTSVHVHVNCLGLTNDQVLNFIYTGYLLESILVDYSGDARVANRFCLRLRDADGLMDVLVPLFQTIGKDFKFHHRMNQNEVKYSAMNLATLRTMGTLEFRSMRGNMDQNVLTTWCNALVNMREFAKKFKNAKEIQNKYMDKLDKLIPDALGKKEAQEMANDFSVHKVMESFSLTYELPNLIQPEEEKIKGLKIDGIIFDELPVQADVEELRRQWEQEAVRFRLNPRPAFNF